MPFIRIILLTLITFCIAQLATRAQPEPIIVSSGYVNDRGIIHLETAYGWQYRRGGGAFPTQGDTTSSNWMLLRPSELSLQHIDAHGVIDGWFRLHLSVDSTLASEPLRLLLSGFGAATVFLDGLIVAEFGNPSESSSAYRAMLGDVRSSVPIHLVPDKSYDLTIRYRDTGYSRYHALTLVPEPPYVAVMLTNETFYARSMADYADYAFFAGVWITGITLLMLLFMLFFYQNSQLTSLKLIAVSTTILASSAWLERIQMHVGGLSSWFTEYAYYQLLAVFVGLIPMVISYLIRNRLTLTSWAFLVGITCAAPVLTFVYDLPDANFEGYYVMGVCLALVFGYSFWVIIQQRRTLSTSQRVVVAGLSLTLFWMLLHTIFISLGFFSNYYRLFTVAMIYLCLPVSFLGYVSIQFNENLRTVERNLREISELTSEKLRVQAEKQELIESQNVLLEHQVAERTLELTERNEELVVARDRLEQAIEDLKSTQEQLVQQEKLASLGQLTAGIAHEIKNPLNFVNNFSQVSIELVDELKEALDKTDIDEAKWIAGDLGSNMKRIHEHGSRADGIVQSMLMHSRSGSGHREPTNLNNLVREYAQLAWHGMRAGKEAYDVQLELDLSEDVGLVPLITEDFSRVILNICNNAFDAMRGSGVGDQESGTTSKSAAFTINGAIIPEAPSTEVSGGATPRLAIRSRRDGDRVVLEFEDNGPGIPAGIKDKILQPFFTTKKGTQGTGLGLSITHDIIKAHGGALEISSVPGKTIFSIIL